jgi:TonB family protein
LDSGGISICEVVASGDKNGLRLLLARGGDVNQTNKSGQTPLILAVVSGQVRLLPLLLEAGADPLLRDNTGLNAIEWAERKGHLDVARQLREKTTGDAKNQTRELSATQEKVVQEPATPLPPAEVSDKSLSDVEKSRRWIAGIKQRLDEKASRVQTVNVDYSTEDERPSEGEPPELQTSSSPQTLSQNPVSSEQDNRSQIGSLTKSKPQRAPSRKKCPQCNAVYDDDLVAYCAFHVVPLVDINAPAPVPDDDESRRNVILWLMVIITFLAAALIGLILFLPRGNQNNEGVAPSSGPKPTSMWNGTPVAGSSLKSKILDLPAAQTALKIEKPETVTVRVKIDNTGRVSSVQSSYVNEELKRAAMDAARKATFSPDKLRGRETAGTITYTFNP